MNAFFVRANFGAYTEVFRQYDFVAIGWLQQMPNDTTDRQQIAAQYKIDCPGDGPGRAGQGIGQVYRFCNEIKVGDIVISTYNDTRLIVGKITGAPYFQKDDLCPFFIRINVDWQNEVFLRQPLTIPTQNTLRSSLTVFRIPQVAEIAQLAGYQMLGMEAQPAVETMPADSNLHELIRQKLLLLHDSEFEILVSYILQSLGFEATQRRGGTGDGGVDVGGVDVGGVLDVLGVATVKLQVQVKRYANDKINESDIRNFRGALSRGHQGTFITLSDFAQKAISSANNPEKEKIHLINGRKLVELFSEQFEKVMQLLEESPEENKVLLEKLRFKRFIIPV